MEIRYRLIETRKNLSDSEYKDLSLKVVKNIQESLELANKKIALYFPLHKEADITSLKSTYTTSLFYLPVIQEKSRILKFSRWYKELKPGIFNIPIPLEDEFNYDLDYIFVPLVAYTNNLYRIGRGGGYYDVTISFLRNRILPSAKIIGIGFSFQEVEFTPQPHDAKLDFIINEKIILN